MSGVTLSVRVSPRASQNEVTVDEAGALVVRTTSPPADGAANKAVIKLLSDALRVSKSSIRIKSGETSRSKVLIVEGLNEDELRRRLGALSPAKKNGSA